MRGRIGQPSVPLSLNPDARCYLGLKIGRRSFDMVVIDFCGKIRASRNLQHAYPTPAGTEAFVKSALPGLLRSAKITRSQISGTGVAMPSQLWQWTRDFDAPQDDMDAWRDFDAQRDLSKVLPHPVLVENDGTAACRAEWVFAGNSDMQDSIYFFIGTFIGGGIILNGSVFRGCHGNAGGFGPLRVPVEPGGTRLIDHASLIVLGRMVGSQGGQSFDDLRRTDDWSAMEPALSEWIERAARSLAHAVISSAAVIDFRQVVIDGSLPPDVRTRVVDRVNIQLRDLDLQGIQRPVISAGHFGANARALGAASMHISSRFMIDHSQDQARRVSP
jgi:predicted NBD/HSP70 family sugar kinase